MKIQWTEFSVYKITRMKNSECGTCGGFQKTQLEFVGHCVKERAQTTTSAGNRTFESLPEDQVNTLYLLCAPYVKPASPPERIQKIEYNL
jgi:hypothetical protein